MMTYFDEPCPTNTSPPSWNLSPRGSRKDVSEKDFAIALKEAKASSGMA
jgi:hypothetical protein